MGFMVVYILFIISIICFLLMLFVKYMGIQLQEQIKKNIYKIPKARETLEKLYAFFARIRILRILKLSASNITASLRKVRPGRVKMIKASPPVVSNGAGTPLQKDLNISTAGSTTNSDDFKCVYGLFDRSDAVRKAEPEKVIEEEYKEHIEHKERIEHKVIVHEPVSTNPISIMGNIANSVPLAVANGLSDTCLNTSLNMIADSNIKTVPDYSDSSASNIIKRSMPIQARPEVLEKEQVKKEMLLERLTKKRPLKEEYVEQPVNRLDKVKPKKKKYEIVQTGYVSVFFSKSGNVTIIPYARDINGKGRAMDAIMYLKYPIAPDKLGREVKESVNLGNDVYPYSDKEFLKKLDVKEWCDFTFEKRHISIKFESGCGYIINATTRNSDGSYHLNCPGGIEKIVRKDAGAEELGDTILKLMERCKV